MKILTLAALLAALTMPIAVSAQVAQPPVPAQAYPTRTQTTQATHEYHRWTKRLAGINLNAQQQQQVQHLLDQFASTHPAGSPRDSAGARALRQQILSVLTPQQQQQYEQEMQAIKARHQQQHMQQMQPQGAPVQPAPPVR